MGDRPDILATRLADQAALMTDTPHEALGHLAEALFLHAARCGLPPAKLAEIVTQLSKGRI